MDPLTSILCPLLLPVLREQIVHGDLKTNNLLVDDDFRVVITDFGLSRMKVGHAGQEVC
jgi:serine/threonine protein kinase